MITTPTSDAPTTPGLLTPVALPADKIAGTPPHDMQQWVIAAASRIVEAAMKRWPRYGPWLIEMTYRDDGRVEWKVQGRSWKKPDIGDKARIGGSLAELEKRVMVDRDE